MYDLTAVYSVCMYLMQTIPGFKNPSSNTQQVGTLILNTDQ